MRILVDFISNNAIKVLTFICGILLLFSFVSPLVFTRYSGIVDFSNTGEIGDTISGLMSPFINIIGVILTFAAFYVQYLFNIKQRDEIKKQKEIADKQFEEQRKKSEAQYKEQQKQINEQSIMNKVTSFEHALFNMINLHTDNLESLRLEMSGKPIVSKIGTQVIAFILSTVDDVYHSIKSDFPELDPKQVLTISYLYIYYGQSLLLNSALIKRYESIYLPVKSMLEKWELTGISHFDVSQNGYSIYLSNYFRILFQIYNYIDNAEYLDLTPNTRYFYSKIIRANLSTDEQVLLYYNFLSPMGKSWVDKKYVFRYKVIKNIPIGNIKTYSPVKWLRSFHRTEFSQSYISDFFEFYSDDAL